MTTAAALDVAKIKADFPLLTAARDQPLVYLDSAATAQKPLQVIDAERTFYETINSNVARGVYSIAEDATNALEGARAKVGRFIGSPSARSVVFTKNATESLNLVAQAWGRANLGEGDAVVLSLMEHHANIVPWQMLAHERGIELRWIGVTDDGQLDLTDLDQLLDGASVLAITAMSNVLGTITPIEELTRRARAAGAMVSVDACQLAPHHPIDVSAIDADFVSFSGHKMCGPTGVGVLWGRPEILEATPPFLGGGGMIENVTTEGFTPADYPTKFEAGTPPIAQIVGLGAAVDYLEDIGMDAIRAHEVQLTAYALRTLNERLGDNIRIHGPAEPAERGGALSLELTGVHPHDISQILDSHGVCVRAGHHCAKPLMRVLGVGATARASLYIYNDEADVDSLADSLAEAHDFFGL